MFLISAPLVMSESQAWKAKHLWSIDLHAAHQWAWAPEEEAPGPMQLTEEPNYLVILGI